MCHLLDDLLTETMQLDGQNMDHCQGVDQSDVPGVVQVSKGPKTKIFPILFLKAWGLVNSHEYVIFSFQTIFNRLELVCFKSRSCRVKYLIIHINTGFIRKLSNPVVTSSISQGVFRVGIWFYTHFFAQSHAFITTMHFSFMYFVFMA